MALALLAAVLVALAAWWVVAGRNAGEQFTVVPGPVPFTLTWGEEFERVQGDGALLALEHRREDGLFISSFTVRPMTLPPYRGRSSGFLPLFATFHIDDLREREAGFRLVEEGKARINLVPGYEVVFRTKRSRGRGRAHGLRSRRDARARRSGRPPGRAVAVARHPRLAHAEPREHGRLRTAAYALPLLPVGHGARRGRHLVPEGPLVGPVELAHFQAVDMRVGRVVAVEDFPEARRPAWRLRIDFGPELGERTSSAQIAHYAREELRGTLVVAVVNFPPRQIGPVRSEVLVLGAVAADHPVRLLRPDPGAQPGDRVAWSYSRTLSSARSRSALLSRMPSVTSTGSADALGSSVFLALSPLGRVVVSDFAWGGPAGMFWTGLGSGVGVAAGPEAGCVAGACPPALGVVGASISPAVAAPGSRGPRSPRRWRTLGVGLALAAGPPPSRLDSRCALGPTTDAAAPSEGLAGSARAGGAWLMTAGPGGCSSRAPRPTGDGRARGRPAPA